MLRRPGAAAFVAISAVMLLFPLMWLVKGSYALLVARADKRTCALHVADADACEPADLNSGVKGLMRISAEVHDLPPDTYIFGAGWYSAPSVGLFSGRHMLDINDMPVARLQAGRPAFLVRAPHTPPSQLQRIRLLYGLHIANDDEYALIPLDSLTPVPLATDRAPVQRHIAAAEEYSYLRGFNESEGSNGRWLSDDNLVLLTPQAGDRFELAVYVMPIARYEYPSAPRVLVSFDGCSAPPQTTVPDGSNDMFFPIPSRCNIAPGTPVNVRIEVDNLVSSQITHDQRPLSILAQSLGFVGGAAQSPR